MSLIVGSTFYNIVVINTKCTRRSYFFFLRKQRLINVSFCFIFREKRNGRNSSLFCCQFLLSFRSLSKKTRNEAKQSKDIFLHRVRRPSNGCLWKSSTRPSCHADRIFRNYDTSCYGVPPTKLLLRLTNSTIYELLHGCLRLVHSYMSYKKGQQIFFSKQIRPAILKSITQGPKINVIKKNNFKGYNTTNIDVLNCCTFGWVRVVLQVLASYSFFSRRQKTATEKRCRRRE